MTAPMKYLHHSSGIEIFFGFDPWARVADPGAVCWSDGNGGWDYAAKFTGAGRHHNQQFPIVPEFVIEHRGRILAYQPGLMIEMVYVGHPEGFKFMFYRPDEA